MYSIDFDEWAEPKPFGFSGCLRLRNDAEMMDHAIRTHLPYLDELVICLQPSDDDTEAKAYEWAQHEKVRVVYYPYDCDWIDTPGFYAKDPNHPGHLVHMSNYAASKCAYRWVVKFEGDVVALSSLQHVIDRVKANPDKLHYYGRSIVHLGGPSFNLFWKKQPRNAGFDEGVYWNSPHFKYERRGKFEAIVPVESERTCMGWSALHLKFSKRKHADTWTSPEFVPFTPGNLADALKKYNAGSPYQGIDNPLGEPVLFEEWR